MTTCGNCKKRGQTVAHVRACYGVEKSAIQKAVEAPAATRVADLGPEDAVGIYFKDGTYYKVQQSMTTGACYAKVWLEAGVWDYAGRKPLYLLTDADTVSAEDAAKFGAITGSCVFCMHPLTDERSIAVGYGPICAAKNSLPWGEEDHDGVIDFG